MEQPGGSTFQYFPPFRDLLLFCYMNCNGSAVPAQVYFYIGGVGNGMSILDSVLYNWNFNSLSSLETGNWILG